MKKFVKSKGYESISRDMVQDTDNLSLQAIGLLAHLVSLPDDFEIFKTVLYRRFSKNGRRSVGTAWNELVENKYIVQFRKKDDKGSWEYIYYFSQEKFTDDDIKLIEINEGTSRWDGKREKSTPKSDNEPLYILNSSQPVNGNRSIYKLTNKDLLLNNKDIDTKDTIDTKNHTENDVESKISSETENPIQALREKTLNEKQPERNTSKNDYIKKAFYENTDVIPKKLGMLLSAFYGDDLEKAELVYKNISIAKRKAEKETNTIIQLEDDEQLLNLLINSLSRALRKTETENISNKNGYIYSSVYNTIVNEINARIRFASMEKSGIYFNWLESE